jgi:signal transduction histidine kinase
MRLNRLIGDFLIFARPAAPSFSRTDLNALLKEIVTRFELQKTGTPCKIRAHIPSEPCYASVDTDLLIRAISNVIKNAFEANGDDCVVEVTATRLADVWTTEIADDGEGIAPENIEKIFNPFFTTRTKGAGLGLAYASQAIKTHGGVISAKNRTGGGALFRVEIPVSQEVPSAAVSEKGNGV